MSFDVSKIEQWAKEHPAETAIGAGIVVIALTAAAKAKGATGGGGPTGIPVASAAQGSVSPLGSGGLVGGGGYGNPTTPYNPYQQQQALQAQAQNNSFLSSLITPFTQGLAKDLFGQSAPASAPAASAPAASAPAPSALSGSYSAPAPSVATTPAGVPVYPGGEALSQSSVQDQENELQQGDTGSLSYSSELDPQPGD